MKRLCFGLTVVVAGLLPTAVFGAGPSYSEAELTPDGHIVSRTLGDDGEGAIYQAGSISKFACSLAALRLAEAGRLDLDAPLSVTLPEYENPAAQDVTLRQVLANRSGLPDRLLAAFQEDPAIATATLPPAEAANRFAAGELAFTPGAQWSYDLVNWIVAQAVIERVTGKELPDALEELIFKPAGMGHSHVFLGQLGPDGQEPSEPARPLPNYLRCAGGIATQPGDLIALLRFADHGGLSAASLKQLNTITTPEQNYTLGSRYEEVETADGKRFIRWLTGSNGPYKSVAVYDRVTDTGYAAMSARDDREFIHQTRDSWISNIGKGED
ncbi:serine hydrolase domain-containing protein [Altericroceibacterium endophyticum]|uniref:Serine hydrolase n=1 Tax=Altericroceibacterium endophyticum TaxID=1808508 RepID=A0A6I4T6N6_9SPHN|nr:serine hydrolase domain-containing protein [Altericroceibacterium endophyticum]MXO65872.1 serine hydrolase [Altericroceibacterium endophyticum]